MRRESLQKQSTRAVTDYFAKRPLLSEPWEEKYRRNSQLVSSHSIASYALIGYAAVVFVLGVATALGFGDIPLNRTDLSVGLITFAWSAAALLAIVSNWRSRHSRSADADESASLET
ncbi:MAG: hypothetical protein AAGM22_02175 [Acidobacteriota bacterium]